jgi:hypothetical protein
VHASALLDRGLTLRGATIGSWIATTSPEQRVSDTNAACLMAQAFSVQFDVASIYPIAELSDAIRHAAKPGKTGTVLVRP